MIILSICGVLPITVLVQVAYCQILSQSTPLLTHLLLDSTWTNWEYTSVGALNLWFTKFLLFDV